MLWFLRLENLIFEFVSNFVLRISNFVDHICVNYALWASAECGSAEPVFLLDGDAIAGVIEKEFISQCLE